MTFMSMGGAQLVSTLPPEWGTAGAFPELFQLYLYGNPGLSGETAACHASLHACWPSVHALDTAHRQSYAFAAAVHGCINRPCTVLP